MMYRNEFRISVSDAWERLLSDRYVSFLRQKYALFENQSKTDESRLNHIGFNVDSVPRWIKTKFGIEESIVTVEEATEYDHEQRIMNWTVRYGPRPDLFCLCGQTHVSRKTIGITIDFRSRWTIVDGVVSSIIFREMRSTFEQFLQQCSCP